MRDELIGSPREPIPIAAMYRASHIKGGCPAEPLRGHPLSRRDTHHLDELGPAGSPLDGGASFRGNSLLRTGRLAQQSPGLRRLGGPLVLLLQKGKNAARGLNAV